MANVKITDLPSLTGVNSASTDVLPVVDISTDTTSKMTRAEFFLNVPAIDVVGAITGAAWNGDTITAPYGGTGITSYAIGDLVFASTTTALSKLADVATGNALISGGVGVAPSYGKIGLTTHISGTLPVANGGTNITSYAIGDLIYASTTGVLSKLADVATGNALISGGVGVAPAYGKIGLTTHISGTLPVANGGTNITSYTVGSIPYASAAGVISQLLDVAAGNVIISGGVGVAPAYGKVGLTTHVSGTLPVANGGTGVTTAPAEAARIMGYTTVATAAGTTVLDNTSSQYQLFTGATTQTITLPVTSTLTTGWTFHIVNNSTGHLTVNSSGANLVATVIPNTTLMVTCIGTTLTTAADWEFGFTDFGSVTGTGSVVLATGPAITGGSINNMTVGATTAATVKGSSLTSESIITDGFITHANGTLALAFGTDGVCKVTPTATGTFTSTVPAAGTRSTLIVLTTGTTSFTMTFGTGFKTTGTLATGTVAARHFVFQFISDGTSLIECSRTVAIA